MSSVGPTMMILGGVMLMVHPLTVVGSPLSEMIASIGRSLRWAFRLERAPNEMCDTLHKLD